MAKSRVVVVLCGVLLWGACTSPTYRRLTLEYTESFYDFREAVEEGGLGGVESLDVRNCDAHLGMRGWGPDVSILIAETSDAQDLVELDLSCHGLDDVGVEAIAQSVHLSKLETLKLESNNIREGVSALASTQSLEALSALYLGHNPLNAQALSALAQSNALPALTRLDLRGIADVALIRALSGTALLARLTRLTLSWSSRLTDAALQQLVLSREASTLERLDLDGTGVRDDGVRELARSPYMKHLLYLDLRDLELSDEGVVALSRSPYMRNLVFLDLRGIALGELATQALIETEQLNPHLVLRMDADTFSESVKLALRARFVNLDLRMSENAGM